MRARFAAVVLVVGCSSDGSGGGTDAAQDSRVDMADSGAADSPDAGSRDTMGDVPWDPCADAATPDVGPLIDTPQLAIIDEPDGATLGRGDPSVSYAGDAALGYMTYSAVGNIGFVATVWTRVATSSDHGATWTYAGEVNAVEETTVSAGAAECSSGTTCSGFWIHEVSSIIEDPTDPDPDRRFKVFAHSYLVNAYGGRNHHRIGSIDMWTTAAPGIGATWEETRLLGWTSSSPQSSPPGAINVTTTEPLRSLLGPGKKSQCVVLTEPGAVVSTSNIYLALGCVRERNVVPPEYPIEIVLLRSVDHAVSWEPVGTILHEDDAASLGAMSPDGAQLNAADLFEHDGVHYMFVTPNGDTTDSTDGPNGYRGCLVIPFVDLNTGAVERCDGVPAVLSVFLDSSPELLNGACTWDEGASASGVMILSASNERSSNFFRFSATGLPPI